LGVKGLVVYYNRWEGIYFSPADEERFIAALRQVKPEIEVTLFWFAYCFLRRTTWLFLASFPENRPETLLNLIAPQFPQPFPGLGHKDAAGVLHQQLVVELLRLLGLAQVFLV